MYASDIKDSVGSLRAISPFDSAKPKNVAMLQYLLAELPFCSIGPENSGLKLWNMLVLSCRTPLKKEKDNNNKNDV